MEKFKKSDEVYYVATKDGKHYNVYSGYYLAENYRYMYIMPESDTHNTAYMFGYSHLNEIIKSNVFKDKKQADIRCQQIQIENLQKALDSSKRVLKQLMGEELENLRNKND